MPPDGSTSTQLRQAQGHRVDREVAAREVALEGVAERDLGLAGRAVVGVGAVGGDLDGVAADARADRAELPGRCPSARRRSGATIARIWSGVRVGREVEVVDVAAEEGVAHGSADERELVARRRRSASASGATCGDVGERRQPREGLGDALHASSAKRRRCRAAGAQEAVRAARRRIARMTADADAALAVGVSASSCADAARVATATGSRSPAPCVAAASDSSPDAAIARRRRQLDASRSRAARAASSAPDRTLAGARHRHERADRT